MPHLMASRCSEDDSALVRVGIILSLCLLVNASTISVLKAWHFLSTFLIYRCKCSSITQSPSQRCKIKGKKEEGHKMKEDNMSEMREFHNCFPSMQRSVIYFWPRCLSSVCKMTIGIMLFASFSMFNIICARENFWLNYRAVKFDEKRKAETFYLFWARSCP